MFCSKPLRFRLESRLEFMLPIKLEQQLSQNSTALSLFLYIYICLRILSRYCSCQDSEFRSAIETSSVDIHKLLSKNFFLWIQCQKISLLLFKDGADLRMESFFCKQSPHTLLLGANGFTLLTTCHVILKLMFFFFNFQT